MDEAEIIAMLERQAALQESRKSLSWAEKMAIAARLRDSVVAWRGSAQREREARADGALEERGSTAEDRGE